MNIEKHINDANELARKNILAGFEKGGEPEGTIKDWKSGKVIKQGNKWVSYKQGEGKVSKPKPSEEDQKQLDAFSRMTARLSHHHPQDDCPYGAPYGGYTVSDTRKAITRKRMAIKDKYETPESRKAKAQSENKQWEKRLAEKEAKWDQKAKDMETLSPRQEAINEIIDINYWKTSSKSGWDKGKGYLSSPKYKKDMDRVAKLKEEHGIRSSDLVRQKKGDGTVTEPSNLTPHQKDAKSKGFDPDSVHSMND
jgi:hypothetical protein